MTALCALIVVDRRLLDPDTPVARSWPEFAAAGKESVLVRHVLAHTTGLPDWEGPGVELYDWAAATTGLAATTPQWEPGTAVGYHSMTQGLLVGELVRRITGRSIGDFFAAEVAGPLGADFWIGLPVEHDHRVALTIPPAGRDEDYTAGFSAPDTPTTGATLDGARLLGPETCEPAWAGQFSGEDRVRGMSVSWELGYGRFGGTYGWGGWCGALVMIGPDRQLVVAYATNQLREPAYDDRGMQIAMTALTSV
jgi:CubicO group peptidase (beta-lactamase class C family)